MTARLVALAFLVLALFAGVQTFRLSACKQEAAQQKATIAADVAAAERRAREAEQLMADGARKAADTYAKQIQKARTDADGARTELERLRDALAAAGPTPQDPTAAAGADDAARARFVVGQCVGVVQALGANLDRAEAQLTALQAWAKALSEAP